MAPLRARARRCSSAALADLKPKCPAISARVGGAPHPRVWDLNGYVGALKALSDARLKDNPKYAAHLKLVKLFHDNAESKTVSLERTKRLAQMREEREMRKAEEDADFDDALRAIRDRYQEIIDGLSLKASLDDAFETIKKDFKAHAGREYAASRGEFLNGMLMAEYLGFPFLDSAEFIFFNEDGTFDA